MKDILKEITNVFCYPISSVFLIKESRSCGRLNNISTKDIHVIIPGTCDSLYGKKKKNVVCRYN